MLIVLSLIIFQAFLLIFSPLLKSYPIFSWYYNKLYHPLFKNHTKYRWKYWIVPLFYASIHIYCTLVLYKKLYFNLIQHLFPLEHVLIPLLLLFPLIFGYFTIITIPTKPSNLSKDRFCYDNLIYFPNLICRTCKNLKPARSKHCSICGTCILLADHHCIWVNNCIGLGNYQYFYSFLISNCILFNYSMIRLLGLWSLLYKDKAYLCLLILSTCFNILITAFSFTQFKLVQNGMTSNEESKWFIVHDFLRQGNLVKDNRGRYFFRVKSHFEYLPSIKNSDIFYENTNIESYELLERGINDDNSIYMNKKFSLDNKYLLDSNKNISDTTQLPELVSNKEKSNMKELFVDTESSICYEFFSTNPYDGNKYYLQTYKVIKSYDEIENIYDTGTFWNNLKERF